MEKEDSNFEERMKEQESDPMETLRAGVKQMSDSNLVDAIAQTKLTLDILKEEMMGR